MYSNILITSRKLFKFFFKYSNILVIFNLTPLSPTLRFGSFPPLTKGVVFLFPIVYESLKTKNAT
nr:MAG TPA: hypothetical protein [Herelleviridae sp.]